MHYSTEILLIAINFLTMPFDSARRAASFALVGKLIRACLRKVTFWGLVERFLSIFRSKFSSTTTGACAPWSGTSFYAKLARFECSDQELSSKYWASMKLEWQEYNALLDRNFTYRNQLSDYAIRLSSSSCIFCTSRKVDSSLSSKSHFLESGTSFYAKLARFECSDQEALSRGFSLFFDRNSLLRRRELVPHGLARLSTQS